MFISSESIVKVDAKSTFDFKVGAAYLMGVGQQLGENRSLYKSKYH